MQDLPSLGELTRLFGRTKPDEVAIACDETAVTWRELDNRSSMLAAGLRAMGVAEGDLVSVHLPNGVAVLEMCIAAWKVGATPQPLSVRLTRHELRDIVALAAPAAFVTTSTADLDGIGVTVEYLQRSARDTVAPSSSPAGLLMASTSSGSTGKPKMIISNRRAVLSRELARAWRMDENDVVLVPAPLHHTSPLLCSILGLFFCRRLVIMSRFDERKALETIERHKASWMYLVPTMMNRMMRLPDRLRMSFDLSSVHTMWHLGAPCASWLKRAWIDWIGPDHVWELYGAADGQACTVINGSDWLAHPGSVGRVADGEMKIVSEDGEDLPPGSIGEIYMRRPPGQPGSYHYRGAEARQRGDWESVGDMGWIDAGGYVYLADRRTDMVLIGGVNVYPAEVEAVLDEHPAIRSSAVIGLPDADVGNSIHAVIEADPDVDRTDIAAFVAERLAPHKWPKSYEVVSNPLRDDAGKVRRYELRNERLQSALTPT